MSNSPSNQTAAQADEASSSDVTPSQYIPISIQTFLTELNEIYKKNKGVLPAGIYEIRGEDDKMYEVEVKEDLDNVKMMRGASKFYGKRYPTEEREWVFRWIR
ncbi:uncharacterized protein I303_105128 [Kwoniella dejecticola CBS 10117]|uniref:Uncharacterized protein n=1 Tax=Kwoniella dejecticola CBS 10117 TaxID=1296121 RepID=A0A1A6A3D2_9TREE|nr:uncharacterized protein I303_05427 [Kwoniella dejecticola CBS 10117]OBR84568.1 hypothetical protein I303_05427 [Kwoniella dejecticola CBS 10117]